MNKIEKEKLKKYQQQIYGNPNWIDGRINRAEYFIRSALLHLGIAVMVMGIFRANRMRSAFDYAILGVCGLMAIWILWRLIMTYVKRAHDLGWSGWVASPIVFYESLDFIAGVAIVYDILNIEAFELLQTLLQFFSILTAVLSLIFLFKRGTKGVNKYGKDPQTKYEELA